MKTARSWPGSLAFLWRGFSQQQLHLRLQDGALLPLPIPEVYRSPGLLGLWLHDFAIRLQLHRALAWVSLGPHFFPHWQQNRVPR